MRRLAVGLAVCSLLGLLILAGFVYWVLGGDGVRAALEQQATARLGQPVRIGAASVQFYPRVGVSLSDVTIGEPAAVTLARVTVSTSLGSLFRREIRDGEVTIADSHLNLPLPPLPAATGPSAGAASSAGGDTSSGVTVTSIRRIQLRNITAESRGRSVTVSADSSLTSSVLSIESLSIATERTTIAAQGTAKFSPALDVDIGARADRLDVDDLIAVTSAFGSTPAGGGNSASGASSTPMRLVARVTARTAVAGGLEVEELTTVVRAIGSRLSLSPTAFKVFGGRYDGDLDVDLRDGAAMRLTARLTALDAARLAEFGGAAGTVTGRLSANGEFSGRGADLAAVLAGARGTGTVTVTDGSIRRLNLVRTVVVFFGRPAPDAPAASDSFSRLDARVSLANQQVSATAFSLTSRDADIAGEGSIDLQSGALDGRLDLSLSEALSQEAGTDFARYTREGNRIILPARLGGTLDQPRLTIDAAAAVRRGLRNELDRRMRGLLDRLGPQ